MTQQTKVASHLAMLTRHASERRRRLVEIDQLRGVLVDLQQSLEQAQQVLAADLPVTSQRDADDQLQVLKVKLKEKIIC